MLSNNAHFVPNVHDFVKKNPMNQKLIQSIDIKSKFDQLHIEFAMCTR